MHRYIQATDEEFDQLEQRCRTSCVRSHGQPLPPGCQPVTGMIGFEWHAVAGVYRLLLQRGVIYLGGDEEIADWVQRGVREFVDFAALRDWVRGPLGAAYKAYAAGCRSNPTGGSETSGQRQCSKPAPFSTPAPDPEQLTSLSDVVAAVTNSDTSGIYCNPEVLFSLMQKEVRGQEEALRRICHRVCRHASRVTPRRPATVFLVGPTGVGKTKSAESIARQLSCIASNRLEYGYLRLDMNEYQESHRVSQLLGAPQGYVGHGEGSQLLDALFANPRTVVLFDEIEKAHPRIFQTLMNGMDAGRLSSASRQGGSYIADCRQAIFLFTSNLAAAEIQQALSQVDAANPEVVNGICRRCLVAAGIRPELAARISEFAVFKPLNERSKAEILTQAISIVANEYGVELVSVEPAVIVELLRLSQDGGLGARPLEYLIDEHLGDAFAHLSHSRNSKSRIRVSGPPFRCEPE